MALINLKNGKTIDVDIMWYLNLSDSELQNLEASDAGFEPESPFYNSALSKRGAESEEEEEELKPLDKIDKIDVPERDDT